MNLFHTVATITLRSDASAGFAADDQPGNWDITFPPDLDRLNFRELPAGTPIGRVRKDHGPLPVQVTNETGSDVSDHYLHIEDGYLRITREVMPSMFTLDLDIIRQDCVGYLMERL